MSKKSNKYCFRTPILQYCGKKMTHGKTNVRLLARDNTPWQMTTGGGELVLVISYSTLC